MISAIGSRDGVPAAITSEALLESVIKAPANGFDILRQIHKTKWPETI